MANGSGPYLPENLDLERGLRLGLGTALAGSFPCHAARVNGSEVSLKMGISSMKERRRAASTAGGVMMMMMMGGDLPFCARSNDADWRCYYAGEGKTKVGVRV